MIFNRSSSDSKVLDNSRFLGSSNFSSPGQREADPNFWWNPPSAGFGGGQNQPLDWEKLGRARGTVVTPPDPRSVPGPAQGQPTGYAQGGEVYAGRDVPIYRPDSYFYEGKHDPVSPASIYNNVRQRLNTTGDEHRQEDAENAIREARKAGNYYTGTEQDYPGYAAGGEVEDPYAVDPGPPTMYADDVASAPAEMPTGYAPAPVDPSGGMPPPPPQEEPPPPREPQEPKPPRTSKPKSGGKRRGGGRKGGGRRRRKTGYAQGGEVEDDYSSYSSGVDTYGGDYSGTADSYVDYAEEERRRQQEDPIRQDIEREARSGKSEDDTIPQNARATEGTLDDQLGGQSLINKPQTGFPSQQDDGYDPMGLVRQVLDSSRELFGLSGKSTGYDTAAAVAERNRNAPAVEPVIPEATMPTGGGLARGAPTGTEEPALRPDVLSADPNAQPQPLISPAGGQTALAGGVGLPPEPAGGRTALSGGVGYEGPAGGRTALDAGSVLDRLKSGLGFGDGTAASGRQITQQGTPVEQRVGLTALPGPPASRGGGRPEALPYEQGIRDFLVGTGGPTASARGGGGAAQPQQLGGGADVAGYVSAKNAPDPQVFDTRLQAIAAANRGANETQINLKAVIDPAKMGDMQTAQENLAALRARYNSANAHVQGAAGSGDLETATKLATWAHNSVPDNRNINYKPDVSGNVIATVSNTDGSGQATNYTLTPKQFLDFQISQGTDFDHLIEVGADKLLQIASSQGVPPTAAAATAATDTTGVGGTAAPAAAPAAATAAGTVPHPISPQADQIPAGAVPPGYTPPAQQLRSPAPAAPPPISSDGKTYGAHRVDASGLIRTPPPTAVTQARLEQQQQQQSLYNPVNPATGGRMYSGPPRPAPDPNDPRPILGDGSRAQAAEVPRPAAPVEGQANLDTRSRNATDTTMNQWTRPGTPEGDKVVTGPDGKSTTQGQLDNAMRAQAMQERQRQAAPPAQQQQPGSAQIPRPQFKPLEPPIVQETRNAKGVVTGRREVANPANDAIKDYNARLQHQYDSDVRQAQHGETQKRLQDNHADTVRHTMERELSQDGRVIYDSVKKKMANNEELTPVEEKFRQDFENRTYRKFGIDPDQQPAQKAKEPNFWDWLWGQKPTQPAGGQQGGGGQPGTTTKVINGITYVHDGRGWRPQ